MSKKKLLYLSCHETLEHEELTHFLNLGFEVFSLGYYLDPNNITSTYTDALPITPRPDLLNIIKNQPKKFMPGHPYKLPKGFAKEFDVIVSCHYLENVLWNIEELKNKILIRRSIGLNHSYMEKYFSNLVKDGLKTVRAADTEKNQPGYYGGDVVITGGVDIHKFKPWEGSIDKVLTVNKWLKRRTKECRFDVYEQVTNGLPRILCGLENKDIPYAESDVPSDIVLDYLSKCKCYFSLCTQPACLTYTFLEAMAAGIPIVSIGPELGNSKSPSHGKTFQNCYMLENGVSGFVSDSIPELKTYIQTLMKDDSLQKQFSAKTRLFAKNNFSFEVNQEKWKNFFNQLGIL